MLTLFKVCLALFYIAAFSTALPELVSEFSYAASSTNGLELVKFVNKTMPFKTTVSSTRTVCCGGTFLSLRLNISFWSSSVRSQRSPLQFSTSSLTGI